MFVCSKILCVIYGCLSEVVTATLACLFGQLVIRQSCFSNIARGGADLDLERHSTKNTNHHKKTFVDGNEEDHPLICLTNPPYRLEVFSPCLIYNIICIMFLIVYRDVRFVHIIL